jgi:hypothetical protein
MPCRKMGRAMVDLVKYHHRGSNSNTRYSQTELNDLVNLKSAFLRSGSTFRCWLEGKNSGPKEQNRKRL